MQERAGLRTNELTIFRADVEGLRALAVLLVVAFHAAVPGFGGGFVGVDVFFVISGYLITGLLLAELDRKGRVDFVAFYARRARRLLPAAWLVLTVTLFVGAVVLSPIEQELLGRTGRATAVYVSNFWFLLNSTDYFGHGVGWNPLLHTWSLAVEEQFYLVWPLLILVGYRLARTRRGLALLLGAFSAVSLAASLWIINESQPHAFFGSHARAWEFGIGGLVRLIPARFLGARPLATLLSWCGLVLVVGTAWGIDESMRFPGWLALLPVLGTAVLLLGGAAGVRVPGVTFMLHSAPAQILGRLSYSWYLWHWPVLAFALAVHPTMSAIERGLLGIGSLIPAALSFRLLESPLRRSQPLIRAPGLTLGGAALVTLAGVGMATLSLELASNAAESPAQRTLSHAVAQRSVAAPGCHLGIPDVMPSDCRYGDTRGELLVVLFGDSHALQWLGALDAIGKNRGWKVLLATKSGCPAADMTPFLELLRRPYAECSAWRERVLQMIEQARPDLVVVANLSPVGAIDERDSSRAHALTAHEWREAVRSTLVRLNEIGVPTALIHDIPRPTFDVPICLSRAIHRAASTDPCDFVQLAGGGSLTKQAERNAASGIANVRVVDLGPTICPTLPCKVMHDGRPLFRDSSHISVPSSIAFAPVLEAALLPSLTKTSAAAELTRGVGEEGTDFSQRRAGSASPAR